MTQGRYSHHWRSVTRPRILYRDRYRCAYCGGYATTVDHVVPLIEGGAMHDPANLVAACKPCNDKRGGLTRAARTVRRERLPSEPRRVYEGAIRL